MKPSALPEPTAPDRALLIRHAADDIAVPAPPIAAIVERARRRRRVTRNAVVSGAVAAATVAVVTLTTLTVASPGRQESSSPITSGSAPAAGCPDTLTPQVVPQWARTGFGDPEPRMPLVLSDRGQIVALVFGDPLTAPPTPDHNNKILWVAQTWGAPLEITATLDGTDLSVTRRVADGPAPSIIDLPRAGCWQLHLRWGSATDTLRLRYAPG